MGKESWHIGVLSGLDTLGAWLACRRSYLWIQYASIKSSCHWHILVVAVIIYISPHEYAITRVLKIFLGVNGQHIDLYFSPRLFKNLWQSDSTTRIKLLCFIMSISETECHDS